VDKACRCQAIAVERYRARISGPLLDRIDALIEVPALTLGALEESGTAEPSAVVRERVAAARDFRRQRPQRSVEPVAGLPEARLGAALEDRGLLTADARRLLRQALVKDSLSGRAYVRIIGLARTIADLDGTLLVDSDHLAEALALRLDHRRVGFC
jgi:magnesium chelatase family protein